MMWTGFVWDTWKFKLFMLEEELNRLECLLEDVLQKRSMKVRRLVKVAGMIGSFYLAMGNV